MKHKPQLLNAILLCCFFSALNTNAWAQTAGQPIVSKTVENNSQSLEGTSPEKNYSVDMFTGTLGVQIPIYHYKIDGLDLSVGIGYNGKGVKVDEIASSVGLGWDVQAGGYITRQVYGIEDEGMVKNSPVVSNGYENFFGRFTTGGFHEFESDVFKVNLPSGSFQFTFDPNAIDPKVRISPMNKYQVYVFNENSSQYNALHNLYDPNISSYTNSQLLNQGNYGGNTNNLAGEKFIKFLIVDEAENSYLFYPGENEKQNPEYSQKPPPNQGSTTYGNYYYYPVTKWVLRRIITRGGSAIWYNYNFFNNVEYKSHLKTTVTETEYNSAAPTYSGIKVEKELVSWTGTMCHISSIDFPNNTTVYFNLGSSPSGANQRCDCISNGTEYVLNNIVIKNKYSNNSFKYVFKYAYFNLPLGSPLSTAAEIEYGGTCDDLKTAMGFNVFGSSAGAAWQYHQQTGLRLKLKGIEKVGMNNINEPYYSFQYDNTSLPRRVDGPRDIYGYYNGKAPVIPVVTGGSANCVTGNATIGDLTGSSAPQVPIHKSKNIFFGNGCQQLNVDYGMDRSDDADFAKAGILTQIRNGNGGYTEFTYGSHVLTNPPLAPNQNPQPLRDCSNVNDGLRINTIKVDDGLGNSRFMEYTYFGGKRFNQGGFCSYRRAHPNWTVAAPVMNTVWSNNFINPTFQFNGSNHGYDSVQVKQYAISPSDILSLKGYQFSNIIDYANGGVTLLVLPYFQQNSDSAYRFAPPQRLEQHRLGLLLSETKYSNNAQYVESVKKYKYDEKLYTTGIGYTSAQDLNYATINHARLPDVNGLEAYTVNYWPFTTKVMQLARIINYHAFLNKSFLDTTMYTYYPNGHPETIERRNSNFLIEGVKYLCNSMDCGAIKYTNINNDKYIHSCLSKDFANVGTSYAIYRHHKTYEMRMSAPVSPTNYGNSFSSAIDPAICQNTHLVRESTKYDEVNNLLESLDYDGSKYTSFIWDRAVGQCIATVENAQNDDIAFSSFEGQYEPKGTTSDYDNKGNWDFNPANIISVPYSGGYRSITGARAMNLEDGYSIDSRYSLKVGKKYKLTFWSSAAPDILYNNKILATPVPKMSLAPDRNYYEIEVVGLGVPIGLQGVANQTIIIDELRLYPVEATMSTVSFEPLFGPATMCNESNGIIRYEYDAFGRLTNTRDIRGRILSVIHRGTATTDNY